MKKPEIHDIIKVLNEQKFVVFTEPYSVNLGGIRAKDNESNKFNDWLYAFYYTEDDCLSFEIVEGTTDAGLYFRKNLANKDGTAIIQHGKQYRGVYQLQDPNKNPELRGHKGQKAFRQIKEMDYWRDNDEDHFLNFEGDTFRGIAYTNGHYMGTFGNNVGKWSAGCWGSTIKNMNDLHVIAQQQIDHGLGDIFSYTLLHEKHF